MASYQFLRHLSRFQNETSGLICRYCVPFSGKCTCINSCQGQMEAISDDGGLES